MFRSQRSKGNQAGRRSSSVSGVLQGKQGVLGCVAQEQLGESRKRKCKQDFI